MESVCVCKHSIAQEDFSSGANYKFAALKAGQYITFVMTWTPYFVFRSIEEGYSVLNESRSKRNIHYSVRMNRDKVLVYICR